MNLPTTIYNPTKPRVPSRDTLINQDWNIEGFFPEGWFSLERQGRCLFTFLNHTGITDFYIWVAETPKFPRSQDETKFTPYNYKRLLGRFAPHFLSLYWDQLTQEVVQIDSKALKNGIRRERRMNVQELNGYIYGQFKRARLLLPRDNSIIDKVFNTKWMHLREENGGDRHQFFPLSCSVWECQNYLPHLNEVDGQILAHVEGATEEKKQSGNVVVTSRLGLVWFKIQNKQKPMKNMLVDYFWERQGEEMSIEAFHATCDRLGFGTDKPKGRARRLNSLLKPEGIYLEKRRVRVNGTPTWFYVVMSITAEAGEVESYDYQAVRFA